MSLSLRSVTLLLVVSYGYSEMYKVGESGHQYTLNIYYDTFLIIDCESNAIHVEELPRSVATVIRQFSVKDCELPEESSHEIIATLGARYAGSDIKLDGVPRIKRIHLTLRSVEEIYISNSGLASNALQQHSGLKKINLLNSNLNLTEASFRGLPNLEILALTECRISDLPKNIFKSLSQLRTLELTKNLITKVKNTNFEGLVSLEVLNLSENELTSLPDDFLHFLPSLEKFYLTGNPLRKLATNSLKGTNLSELYIKNNAVPLTLAPQALAEMPRLKYLDIRNCRITALPADLLEGSNAVVELDLSNNYIQDLPKDFFKNKNNLLHLKLNNNRLSVLSSETFAHLSNLRILELNYNSITIISAGVFTMNKLVYMWIENNGVREVSPEAFPVSIEQIHLDNNQLTTLETTLKPALRNLYLNNNSFSRIPATWRDTLPALTRLRLVDNAFTELKESDLVAVQHCEDLDLSNNNIVSVLVGRNTTLPKYLWLRYAPLHCDCRLHEFATHLQKNWADESIVCTEPETLKGSELINVPFKELVCQVESCPNTCTCVVRPATKALEVECREQLTTDQFTELETLRLQHYSDMTLNTTISYIDHI